MNKWMITVCVFPIAGFQDQQEITIPYLLHSTEVWFYGQCRAFSFCTHGPGGSAGHKGFVVCCLDLFFSVKIETAVMELIDKHLDEMMKGLFGAL